MDKVQQTEISLIISVYNMEEYLEKCLETAVSQTYHNYEIIIVDDGSIDNSYQICVEYSKRYDNIVLIHKENEGLMSAWQCGFFASKGEYISFLDSDDWIEADYIERLSQGINVDADVTCCNKIWEFEDGIILKKELLNPGCYDRKALVEKVFPQILNDGSCFGRQITRRRCGKLFKKDILQNNIVYCDKSISYGEDLNIVFPVLIDCKRLLVLDDETGLYHYRQNNISIIRSYKKNMFAQIDKLHAKLIEVNDKKKVYDFRTQIDADAFCLFLDYVKNEAKNIKEKKNKISNILNNYQIFKKTFKGNSYKRIKLKTSNKILVFLLERKMLFGLYIWCNLYYIIRKKSIQMLR